MAVDYLMLFAMGCFGIVIIIQAIIIAKLQKRLDDLDLECDELAATGNWWKQKCLKENTIKQFKNKLPEREEQAI